MNTDVISHIPVRSTTPRAAHTAGLPSTFRHWLWRMVCAVSGGLTVNGRWSTSGGCVVVANHASHADTAVLLAALPPAARPVFGAAADYWFEVPVAALHRHLLGRHPAGTAIRRRWL